MKIWDLSRGGNLCCTCTHRQRLVLLTGLDQARLGTSKYANFGSWQSRRRLVEVSQRRCQSLWPMCSNGLRFFHFLGNYVCQTALQFACSLQAVLQCRWHPWSRLVERRSFYSSQSLNRRSSWISLQSKIVAKNECTYSQVYFSGRIHQMLYLGGCNHRDSAFQASFDDSLAGWWLEFLHVVQFFQHAQQSWWPLQL